MKRLQSQFLLPRVIQPVAALFALLSWGGAESLPKEYQVKAAFIYNFTQFAEWPAEAFASAEAEFVIVVAGTDPFEGALDKAMSGKSVGSHPVTVKHVGSANEITTCHLLYIGASQESWMSTLVAGGKPTLYVGESDSFLESGGTIRFFMAENKLRFEVNLDAVEKARLKISSKLLKLAQIHKK